MSSRNFALIFGIVFLLVGIAGFVPQLVSPPEGGAMNMHGEDTVMLLGMFPVNLYHNLVHILFGLWGLAASRSATGSVTYARGVAIIYAVLTIAGFVPALDTLWGMVPLYGNDVWLHLGLAVVAAYFGWVNRNPVTG
jgi:hypothetical protein